MKNRYCLFLQNEKEKIAVIGPLANEWFKDWNGGIPPYRISPYEGIRDVFGEDCVTYTDGKKRLCLRCGERFVCLTQEGQTGAWFALRG